MERAEYLRLHPLFNRLSGQIVWTLFEEYDAPQPDIDAFLDYWLGVMDRTMEVMQGLLDDPTAAVRVELSPQGKACAHCQALAGRFLPGRGKECLPLLPPYSLGCRTRPVLVPASEIPPKPDTIDPAEIPGYSLHCPSEWLFTYAWSQKK